MKKILVFFLLAICAVIPSFAQHKNKDNHAMRKEVQEFKLKFLAQEMELKDDQQKKFFELYTQMSQERRKLFQDTKALEKKLSDSANATDAEYEAVTKSITTSKEKDAEIEKKYDEKFSQFLSPRQIFKMKAAEEKFRNKMHEMKHKKRSEKK